jgi:probable selenium-dependent hydroxylase accessory protein YqeC
MVGAGGKTSALRVLAEELKASGRSVIATTTTAMYARELAAVGPLFLGEDEGLVARLRQSIADGQAAGVAAGHAPGGKVTGLGVAAVDSLWARRLTDYLLVEADGSRRLPFKAFGPGEPVLPSATTTVVQVAGLGVIGLPLTAEHVHRAELMAQMLGVPLGCEVTRQMFVDGLKLQLSALMADAAHPRIVTLLNGADSLPVESLGRAVASDLLDLDRGASVVVLACLRERRAARVLAPAV